MTCLSTSGANRASVLAKARRAFTTGLWPQRKWSRGAFRNIQEMWEVGGIGDPAFIMGRIVWVWERSPWTYAYIWEGEDVELLERLFIAQHKSS